MENQNQSQKLQEIIAKTIGGSKIKRPKCERHLKSVIQTDNGVGKCIDCINEPENDQLVKQMSDLYYDREKHKIYNYLERHSIFDNTEIKESRILEYREVCSETKFAKVRALELISKYGQGNKFNIVLSGGVGVGKTHLAYSILHELNELRLGKCLFVNVDKLIRQIKASWKKGSDFDEYELFDLMENADYLVIDDLGVESGGLHTDSKASRWVSEQLFSIYNSRIGKCTITTTNLSGEKMASTYDSRFTSRFREKLEPILFNTAKDQRPLKPF